ncbi:thioredoxin family protein [Aestuariicella hydrocarbonica]|uniref:Thioredoxin family protein n=1 Tax=Pseudomaricurvus hydrocarbonicus TaxID=1470433 RepID=A0A9E5JSY5_9GAMM|nr:thioredoxin family protein [Aestuariicella hydrocarbonica]NHO66267.1 thioredoxin family protein [Aestuariicella hydrocarbonica]
MIQVKVLGSGCSKCVKTAALIESVASSCGIPVQVEKEASPQVMMQFGVMRTPAVVVDGTLVHAGSIPETAAVKAWLGGR